ncbi:MAG: hypothetical protein GX804_01150 [Lentisphaerae bacterium]|nr:hypothetical protein [Lentisphaerota bacterium]
MKKMIKVCSVCVVVIAALCVTYTLAQDSKVVLNAKQLGIEDLDLDLGLDEDLDVQDMVESAESDGAEAEFTVDTIEEIDIADFDAVEIPDIEEVPEIIEEIAEEAEALIEDLDSTFTVDEVVDAVEELAADIDVDELAVAVEELAEEVPEVVEELEVLVADVDVEAVQDEFDGVVAEVIADAQAATEETVVEAADVEVAVEFDVDPFEEVAVFAPEVDEEVIIDVAEVAEEAVEDVFEVVDSMEEMEVVAEVDAIEHTQPDMLLEIDDILSDTGVEVAEEAAVVELPAVVEVVVGEVPQEDIVAEVTEVTEETEETVDETVEFAEAFAEESVPAVEEIATARIELDPEIEQRVSELEELEESRRKLFDQHGRESIEQGNAALAVANWNRAIEKYNDALDFLLPKEVESRKAAEKGLGEAYYRLALEHRSTKNYDEAEKAAREARHYRHPKGESLLFEIQSERESPPPPVVPPREKRWIQPEYKSAQSDISKRMKIAKEFYATGELRDCRREVELLLQKYPWHKDAVDLLRKVSAAEHSYVDNERITTRESMIKDVTAIWTPRTYGQGFSEGKRAGATGEVTAPVSSTQEQRIMKKMREITIPDLDFRQANISDIVGFLGDASREFDDPEVPADERGINFILNLGDDSPGFSSAQPEFDPFAVQTAVGPSADGATSSSITIKARYVTLLDALDMIMDMAGLKYRVRGNMVMIMPKTKADTELIHKMYNVLPSIEDRVPSLPSMGDEGFGAFGGGFGLQTSDSESKDWKKLFGDLGVPWPDGSSCQYMPSITKLIVVNTAENLATLESVLSILNVTPKQVEIEVRFVEVMQSDLDSLGLEWMVNDDWEIAEMKADRGLPPASRRRVVMERGSINRGFNYLNRNTSKEIHEGEPIMDNIATITSILTNPELSMVLHALSSKQSTDLLSAPKVVTKAGSPATIKVVVEYIYPTEYDVEMLETTSDNNVTTYSGAVVEPQNFNMREVGVILEVTPTVTDDGSMIDLALAPAVVSEPTWKNYGSTYPTDLGPVILSMEQPFFPVRSVATTVQIYNGATVVMGGMITEERFTNEDKIPLLGDIPILGRLFRYKYDLSEKRNLLLFVTAKLVDPAGRLMKDVEDTDQKLAEMFLGERN